MPSSFLKRLDYFPMHYKPVSFIKTAFLTSAATPFLYGLFFWHFLSLVLIFLSCFCCFEDLHNQPLQVETSLSSAYLKS